MARTYIVLLRGVMPMGKNKVPMATLRGVLTADGFGNVRTYIQSGNALVDTDLAPSALERRVHDLIADHIGPDLVVVVRTARQLQRVLDRNPFTDGYDPSRLFFVSFATRPPAAKVKALVARDFTPERVVIDGDAGYLYLPGSGARSRLSNNYLEKQLGVSATTRNLNTMRKLIELGRGPASSAAGRAS